MLDDPQYHVTGWLIGILISWFMKKSPYNWVVCIIPSKSPKQPFLGPYFSLLILGVSKNNGTPKSSILIGFSIINHPFWVHLFLKTSIWDSESWILRVKFPWKIGILPKYHQVTTAHHFFFRWMPFFCPLHVGSGGGCCLHQNPYGPLAE